MKTKYKLTIEHDNIETNPVEDWCDGVQVIVCHPHHAFGTHNFTSKDECDQHITSLPDDAAVFPLYLYDHGGITISLESFNCPWDSGQVGFVAITDRDSHPNALEAAKFYVEELDHCLTGNVWGWVIEDENGDTYDSCWGYYGDPETSGCKADGEAMLKKANVEAAADEHRAFEKWWASANTDVAAKELAHAAWTAAKLP